MTVGEQDALVGGDVEADLVVQLDGEHVVDPGAGDVPADDGPVDPLAAVLGEGADVEAEPLLAEPGDPHRAVDRLDLLAADEAGDRPRGCGADVGGLDVGVAATIVVRGAEAEQQLPAEGRGWVVAPGSAGRARRPFQGHRRDSPGTGLWMKG